MTDEGGSVVDLGIEGVTGLRSIGTGGYSTVYVGVDASFQRQVAVKVLRELDTDGRRRFERELGLMGRLEEHPNVIRPYRSGYTGDGEPYVIMELARGGSLHDLVSRQGPLDWRRAVGYVLPIADALGHAHRQGVLHHDIKPANILLTADDTPKLTDFGIASIVGATATTNTAFTLSHVPPETFADGVDRRDERSDLYSLASTLFTLVRGRTPFQHTGDDNSVAHLNRILNRPVPTLDLGPSIDGFLATAMAKDPAARFQDAAAFTAALAATVGPVGGPSGERPGRWVGTGSADGRPAPPTIDPGSGASVAPRTFTSRPDRVDVGSGPGSGPPIHDGLGPGWAGTGTDGTTLATDPSIGPVVADPGRRSRLVALSFVATVVAVVLVVGTVWVVAGRRSVGVTDPGAPGPEIASETTSLEPATGPVGADGVEAPSAEDDQVVAERIVLQSDDLGPSWATVNRSSPESRIELYRSEAVCEPYVPLIRGDGTTATAGFQEAFVTSNTAMFTAVAFYENESMAARYGPDLLLEPGYQECSRVLNARSIMETNDLDEVEVEVVSRELPVVDYGQRTEAIRLEALFELPELGRKTFYTDEMSVIVGRAVLTMVWTSDIESDPQQLLLFDTVAKRFEFEIRNYEG